MSLEYVKHEKLSLQNHGTLNEKWLQDRIAEDPSILGLGDVRLLDRERSILGGGRLDLLFSDDEYGWRYEVEIQLGATNPSHIIRCIEYWDAERRRYPGYEHVAVLIAEDITSRFLNVVSLMGGNIPIIAIQLDALRVGEQLLLNFTHVLSQAELRTDDTDDDGGGGAADRSYWEQRAGQELMALCDAVAGLVNESASTQWTLSYMRAYIGMQCNGVSNNFILFSPKPTKRLSHILIRNSNKSEWFDRFAEAGLAVTSKRKSRIRLSVTPEEFAEHRDLIRAAIVETVQQIEA